MKVKCLKIPGLSGMMQMGNMQGMATLPEVEICRTLCATSPAPCRRGPCKLFEAHGLTAFGLFPHKALQEQAPDGLVRKKPSAARWASNSLRREGDYSPVLQPFCAFLCITTHFIVNEWVDALFASLFWKVSLCVSRQDLVVFSSWCNFFDLKMHCVQKPFCTWFQDLFLPM